MRALVALFAVVLGLALPASAQVVGKPELIAKLMREAGLEVAQAQHAGRGPVLESGIDEVAFNVYFYDCRPECAAMQFSAGFDLDSTMSMEMVNLWNRSRRFGKVYLDKTGDPYIEMDIGLAGDGIGRKNFRDALETWRLVLTEFCDFIEW